MNKSYLLIATVAAAALASCNSADSANEDIAQLTARRDSLAGIVAKAEAELSQIDLELAALDSSAQWSTVTTLAVGSSAFQHDFDLYGTDQCLDTLRCLFELVGRYQSLCGKYSDPLVSLSQRA